MEKKTQEAKPEAEVKKEEPKAEIPVTLSENKPQENVDNTDDFIAANDIKDDKDENDGFSDAFIEV